jgi:Nucleoside 2-deoxyribosyltransferase/pfkB family carbohydrate kinase
MVVVGGAYEERCMRPEVDDMYGSGLRAAAALGELSPGVRLRCAVDEQSAVAARLMARTHDVDMASVNRDEPVAFDYFIPLGTPAITGRGARQLEAIQVEDSAALVFGMVEAGDIRVTARRLVHDPQRPRELTKLDLTNFDYEQLAIVVNRSEAAALTGGKEGEDAATELAGAYHADVVIIKRAAMGALVWSAGTSVEIGVFPTRTVYPIGSGDVFAAGFAWAWAEQGMEPVRAARVGSLAAAYWCSSRTLPLDAAVGRLETDLIELAPRATKVYVAGPFFTVAEQWLVETCRRNILSMGAQVFSPFHDVGRTGEDIAERDLAGLENCQSVLALLDGADTGTWFEVGWAQKAGIPVVAYAQPRHDPQLKMAKGTGVDISEDLSTALYRAVWAGQR